MTPKMFTSLLFKLFYESYNVLSIFDIISDIISNINFYNNSDNIFYVVFDIF